jgi:copper(I)-binding protein
MARTSAWCFSLACLLKSLSSSPQPKTLRANLPQARKLRNPISWKGQRPIKRVEYYADSHCTCLRCRHCRTDASVLAQVQWICANRFGARADLAVEWVRPRTTSFSFQIAQRTEADSARDYVTIANKGTEPDRVTCVSSDVSAACQIHTMTMDNGVMKMRPAEGGLEIKPGETVTLKPSGSHVMLMELKHTLEQGKMVEATLQFEKAGTVKVDFPVAAIGAAAPGTPAGDGHMMQGHGGRMQMDNTE